jgi:hypothetical protein
MGIQPDSNHATWRAAAIFELEVGRIKSFTKDWDQKVMQIKPRWTSVKDIDNPEWNIYHTSSKVVLFFPTYSN